MRMLRRRMVGRRAQAPQVRMVRWNFGRIGQTGRVRVVTWKVGRIVQTNE